MQEKRQQWWNICRCLTIEPRHCVCLRLGSTEPRSRLDWSSHWTTFISLQVTILNFNFIAKCDHMANLKQAGAMELPWAKMPDWGPKQSAKMSDYLTGIILHHLLITIASAQTDSSRCQSIQPSPSLCCLGCRPWRRLPWRKASSQNHLPILLKYFKALFKRSAAEALVFCFV